jgi:hypothetical protein
MCKRMRMHAFFELCTGDVHYYHAPIGDPFVLTFMSSSHGNTNTEGGETPPTPSGNGVETPHRPRTDRPAASPTSDG